VKPGLMGGATKTSTASKGKKGNKKEEEGEEDE
jgi:hypothetical protein